MNKEVHLGTIRIVGFEGRNTLNHSLVPLFPKGGTEAQTKEGKVQRCAPCQGLSWDENAGVTPPVALPSHHRHPHLVWVEVRKESRDKAGTPQACQGLPFCLEILWEYFRGVQPHTTDLPGIP